MSAAVVLLGSWESSISNCELEISMSTSSRMCVLGDLVAVSAIMLMKMLMI